MLFPIWLKINALGNSLITALILTGDQNIFRRLVLGWPELFTDVKPEQVGPFPFTAFKAEVEALLASDNGEMSIPENVVRLSRKYGFPCLEGGIKEDHIYSPFLDGEMVMAPMTRGELRQVVPRTAGGSFAKKRLFPVHFDRVKVEKDGRVLAWSKAGTLIYDYAVPGECGNVVIGGVPCYACCLNDDYVLGVPIAFFDLTA